MDNYRKRLANASRRWLPNIVEVDIPCHRSTPPELRTGIEEFNAGLYYECHETLEGLWRARSSPDRWLYQGILQVGVSLHHLRRGNWIGAVNLMERGVHLLSAYPNRCQGVEVSALRQSAEGILRYLISEGRDGVEKFDWKLAPKIRIVDHPIRTKGGKMSSNVTVLGGGNTAFALAANLALAGHVVRLAELPAMHKMIEPIRESETITLGGVGYTGEAHLAEVTTDIGAAIEGADLILLAVPAYAHRPFAEACAPHLKAGQIVILLPGTLGSLEFAHVLEENGNHSDVILAEVDTSPYVCRKTGPDTAQIWGVVPRLGLGVRPANQTVRVHNMLAALFPGLIAYRSVLECGFSSMNPIMHPAGVLMNAGRIEYSEGDFYFYKEGVTPGVARVIQQIDRERLAIGDALRLEILPVAAAFHQAGFGPAGDLQTTITGSEMLTRLPAPGSLDTRWLLEDAPYGLVSWASIAEQLAIPTPTIRAVISLCSVLTGQDAWETGRRAEHLGLDGLNAAEMTARAAG